MNQRRKAVVSPEVRASVQHAAAAASLQSPDNIVQPNSGIEKIIIDNSGNRGGLILAGAIALWSLWPQDLFPGFLSVLRDNDLIRRQSVIATASGTGESQYSYFLYRDLNYTLFQNNSRFMVPAVPQVVNGVKDAYLNQFFDDFGDTSAGVTPFIIPPFEGTDYVFVSNSICASTCFIFSSYLFEKYSFDGGAKDSETTDFYQILAELELAGLQDDLAAPQPFPVAANFR
ncbi:hypothetical protein MVEN_02629600 [Mycena venus]|uniref:Uncharacterized protein n=1 Tax=Mycena venus TaxID=2733690 RepID=A0A8H6TYZ3_9AGAR|nr:hypothetical protein MVEN_02629600 [Mycena venus]